MSWVDTPDGRSYCERHKKTFDTRRRERCVECDGDPGPLVVDEAPEPEAPPEGCLSANDHERVLTAMGRDAEAFARKLCTGKGRINYATAAKLFEVAIRAYRAAAEYTQTRERRNHVRWLEKRRRAIGGKRGRN